MALTISSIMTSVIDNLVIESNETITNLSRPAQLEVMKNFSNEIKPSMFFNTDIGNIIDSHIDILSYYLPDFLLDTISPVTGFEYTDARNPSNTWTLAFNNDVSPTINSADVVDTYIELETIRKIYNIEVELLPDQIFYDSLTSDYTYLSVWKLSWDYNGVESFDVYYQFGVSAEVLLYTGLTTDWCNFVLDQTILDLLDIGDVKFIVKSSIEPTIVLTESKLFDTDRVSSSSEVITQSETVRDDTDYAVTISKNIISLNKSFTYLPRDYQTIKVKTDLFDINDTNFYSEYNSYFITLDKFKIENLNVIDGGVSDPNQIIISFNQNIKTGQTLSSLLVLEGSDDEITYNVLGCTYRISKDSYLIINITASADRQYQYYKLSIGNLLDIYNQIISETGTEINFENNHMIVYDESGFVLLDEDNNIIVI